MSIKAASTCGWWPLLRISGEGLLSEAQLTSAGSGQGEERCGVEWGCVWDTGNVRMHPVPSPLPRFSDLLLVTLSRSTMRAPPLQPSAFTMSPIFLCINFGGKKNSQELVMHKNCMLEECSQQTPKFLWGRLERLNQLSNDLGTRGGEKVKLPLHSKWLSVLLSLLGSQEISFSIVYFLPFPLRQGHRLSLSDHLEGKHRPALVLSVSNEQ